MESRRNGILWQTARNQVSKLDHVIIQVLTTLKALEAPCQY